MIPPVVTHYCSVVCPSVCMSSFTLMHPAKAIGQNKVPFGSDSRVFPSNIVWDRCPGFPTWWRLEGQNPQFAAVPPIAKLIWPLLLISKHYSTGKTWTLRLDFQSSTFPKATQLHWIDEVGNWIHVSVTCTLCNKFAKNYCNPTILVWVIEDWVASCLRCSVYSDSLS